MLLAFALSGCATIPAPLEGDYAQEPTPNAATENQRDERVRWGGTLLGMLPGAGGNCMVLLARPLDQQYRPRAEGAAVGRFLACLDESLDPEEFLPGGDVTVTGVLETFEDLQVGDEVHRFPIVRTRSVYAWPMNLRNHRGSEGGGNGIPDWEPDRRAYR